MQKVKVFLDETRKAFVTCGSCGKSKEMSFSDREAPNTCLAKCSCGNAFIVTFEKRQYYRKQVDAYGTCFVNAGSTEGIPVRIMDISLGGVQFQNSRGAALRLNQKLRLSFTLNNELVNLVVCVRHIRGDDIGAEIVSIEGNSKKIIGFYLMP